VQDSGQGLNVFHIISLKKSLIPGHFTEKKTFSNIEQKALKVNSPELQ